MPAETITKKLYNDEVSVVFYPSSHRYKLEGSKDWLTSVTAITGLIDKSRVLILWAIGLAKQHAWDYLQERGDMVDKQELSSVLEEAFTKHQKVKDEAASNGSLVHAWAESYAKSKIEGSAKPAIGSELPDQVIAGINAFLDWVNQEKVKFLETERIVYSKKHGFVGILDVIVEVNGIKKLIDYKTSKGIYDEMYLQVSGYHGAYLEETDEDLETEIAHFDKETGAFSIHPISKDDVKRDYTAFLGLLEAKNRLKERSRV